MNDILGIINLCEDETAIKDLTRHRPIGAIPIAGRYRAIDFILSNMVNIGIQNVAIFTQGKSRSILEHLGRGREWDLVRKKDGLFIFTPYNNPMDSTVLKGDIKNFKDQLDYIRCSKQEYVVFSSCYMICNINLQDAFKYHLESGADITVIYKAIEDKYERFIGCAALNMDADGRVASIGRNIGRESICNVSMDMFILKRSLLLKIIENSISKGEDMYVKEALYQQVKKCNVNGYAFKGYLGCINSTENYYRINMDLLDLETSRDLFFHHGHIYTRCKDDPPAKYKENARVTNSMVANGCIIEGSVEGCVLFRGVRIGRNAEVKDCVIMQKCIINDGAFLQHVILDKNIEISSGTRLQGACSKPLVIMKNQKV